MAKDKTIIRTRKSDNPFVMVDKYGINDVNLSWKAKGILVYLLSKPDDWTVRVEDLIKRAKDGRDSVKAGLRELEANGYLSRHQHRSDDGKFGDIEYVIYERPQVTDMQGIKPKTENPATAEKTENGKSGNGRSGNGKSNTTKNDITKNDITKNDMDGRMGETSSPSQPTISSVQSIEYEWQLFRNVCEMYSIDKARSLELWKTRIFHYSDAPVTAAIAIIKELMNDKVDFKGNEKEYRNLIGLFHHRMKAWKAFQIALDDVEGV